MKRFIKNNLKILVTLIISAILFTGIGVYAATQYYARDISFTPSAANQANGFDATNVEDALNQLYSKNNLDFSNNDTKTAYYIGNRTNNINVSLNLEKGKYIITVINSHALASSSKFNSNGESNANRLNVTNGTCILINGYYTSPTASTLISSTNRYVSNFVYSQIYECELTNPDVLSYITNDGSYDDCSQSVIIQSVKLK